MMNVSGIYKRCVGKKVSGNIKVMSNSRYQKYPNRRRYVI